MSETQNIKEKQPMDSQKKTLLKRILTFVGGGVGIIALILFAIFVTKPSAYVSFQTFTTESSISNRLVGSDFKIDIPKDPTRFGYEFLGWYDTFTKDDKDFITVSGNKIDLNTYEFKAYGKEFKWFGNQGYYPASKTLYAKWELHYFKVLVLEHGKDEPVKDANGNPLEFYFPIMITDDKIKNDFIQEYVKNNEGNPNANIQAQQLANDESISIGIIWNFHLLTAQQKREENKLEFCDREGNIISELTTIKFDRSSKDSEAFVAKYNSEGAKVDENGEFVYVIYVKNYEPVGTPTPEENE